jgi:hypothetical protein
MTTKKGVLFGLAAMAIAFSVASPAVARKDPGCSGSPNQAALGQSWTLSAFGLPTNGIVNLITTYPNGDTLTAPVSPAANGTYSTSTAPAQQTGTYGYQFVGRVRWPAGTFNQTYATCSVQVG